MAHALVLHVKLPQEGSPEDSQKMLEEVVVPLAKSQVGFMNGTWLHDGAGNGMGVIVFATAAGRGSGAGRLEAAARRSPTGIQRGPRGGCSSVS